MEIYIAMLEEDARQAGKELDLKAVGDRDEGIRKEYEHACIIAQDCLAKHQNMSDIRNGLSIDDTQQPRAALIQNAVAPVNAGRQYKDKAKHQNMSDIRNGLSIDETQYKANGEFKPDTLTKDASAGQYEFWKRQFKRYYNTSNMDLAPGKVYRRSTRHSPNE